ncbi:hypothetical protein BBAD15_g5375 [Beauveria bassiana D1-5]|uniref:Uncharacterized protein n=1 Tax=Beauveria bassiana D1-5 TaxID=1245745 RepID=A0A0A2VN08_BEABA|nr:hypothetical protein BBAD15_g5375 [Beauveria bassiana D1-5]
MVTNGQNGTIRPSSQRAAQHGQPLPDRHNLALDNALCADGRGPQVRDVEAARDAHEAPVARPADEGERHGRGPVKERGNGAAVHVVAGVVVALGDGEGEEDGRVRRGGVDGEELDVGRDAALPVLESRAGKGTWSAWS